MGFNLDLDRGAGLGADIYQAKIIETRAWTKILSAFWRQEIGENLAAKISWNKAIESGAYSPYFSLALTWYFSADDGSTDADNAL